MRSKIKPAFFVFSVSAWALISVWVYRHTGRKNISLPFVHFKHVITARMQHKAEFSHAVSLATGVSGRMEMVSGKI